MSRQRRTRERRSPLRVPSPTTPFPQLEKHHKTLGTIMWPVLAAWSMTLTNFLFQHPLPNQVGKRTPHRVCSFTALRNVKRVIKQIVAVRPAANQQGGQTSKHPGGQPEHPLVQKPANSHRNHDKLAGQDQGHTTNTHAATLELPISVVTEKPDESNAPPRQGSPTPLKPRPPKSEQPKPQQPMDPRKPPVPQPPEQNKRKSTCGFSHYDLLLTTSFG